MSSMTSSYSSPAITTRLRNSGEPSAAAAAGPDVGRVGGACASSAGEDGHLGPRPRARCGGWRRQATVWSGSRSASSVQCCCRAGRRGGGAGGVDLGRAPHSSPFCISSPASLSFIIIISQSINQSINQSIYFRTGKLVSRNTE